MLSGSPRRKSRLVYGVGMNDADYQTQPNINGKTVICMFYSRWTTMLSRCYSEKVQKRCPTYIGCSVCDDWLLFSSFKKWMEKQDWNGRHLDKDLLIYGNKIYSPEACLFVPQEINKLLRVNRTSPTKRMIGTIKASKKRFVASCNDGKGNTVHLGLFETEQEAHNTYCDYKYKIIKEIALQQSEPLKSALLNYKISEY